MKIESFGVLFLLGTANKSIQRNFGVLELILIRNFSAYVCN